MKRGVPANGSLVADGYSRGLVVEDEAVLRHFLAATLRDFGFKTIREAAEGKQALEILFTSPVDIIISDWHMPAMDGLHLLRRIRRDAIWDLIPFVLMSADRNPEAAREALDEGADAFLFKPIKGDRFEECVRKVIAKRKISLEARIALSRARAMVDAGLPDQARTEVERARTGAPESAFVWVEAGKVEERLGWDDSAEQCFRKALAIEPGFVRAHDHLADLLSRQGRLDEAFRALEAALALRPDSAERHYGLARLCMTAGDEAGARRALACAVAKQGSEAARHGAAAEFFLEHGRADLAVREYAFALEAAPDNLHYYNRMGIALRRQERFAEAVANYRNAIKLAPADPILYYNLARALLGQGDKGYAAAALRKALIIEPQFEEAEVLLQNLTAKEP